MHVLSYTLAIAALFLCTRMFFRAKPDAAVCVFLAAALALGAVAFLDGPYLLQGGCVKEVEALYVLRSGGERKNHTYALSDGEGNQYWGIGKVKRRYTAAPVADTRARIAYLPYSGMILSVESKVIETHDMAGQLLLFPMLLLPAGLFALARRRRGCWKRPAQKVRRQAPPGREEARRTFRIGRGG